MEASENQSLHIVGRGAYEYIEKIEQLIPTQLSRKYNNDIAYS